MEDPDSVVNDTAEQFEKLRKFVEDWGGVAREVAETAGDAVGKARHLSSPQGRRDQAQTAWKRWWPCIKLAQRLRSKSGRLQL